MNDGIGTLQLGGEILVVLGDDNFIPLRNDAVVPLELRARYDRPCNSNSLIGKRHRPVNVWKDRGVRECLVYGRENVRFQN